MNSKIQEYFNNRTLKSLVSKQELLKEPFGAKRSEKPFHPHLGPPPSRGRKINEGCPLAAWF